MSAETRVISIGTLPAHPLWEERAPVRTGHATTTLVTSQDTQILVDPGLPAAALAARLGERTSVRPEAITHVFLTSFTTDHLRGLPLLRAATWLLHEPERQAAEAWIASRLDAAAEAGDAEGAAAIRGHAALLERFTDAPDRLAPGVDLFPLPGVTPGLCGLLVAQPTRTVLLCGDAVATREHLARGQVLAGADREQAQESFREALEIADLLIPGRDEPMASPLRGGGF